MLVTPVTLPPGRLRLVTRPAWTGSAAVPKTIGMVAVAALAANAAALSAGAARTATWRRIRSAANSGSRSRSLLAQRYSIATLRPSPYPLPLKPLRKAATRAAVCSGELAKSAPPTGTACCCARAASGHAAAPPSAASNSRRPMVTVIRPSRARCVKETIPRHERAVLPFQGGRMLVAVVRVESGKAQFFRFAPESGQSNLLSLARLRGTRVYDVVGRRHAARPWVVGGLQSCFAHCEARK